MSQIMWKARTHPPVLSFYHMHILWNMEISHICTCTYTYQTHKIIFKRSLPGRVSLLAHFLSMLLVYSLVYSAFCVTAPSFSSVVPHLSAYFISSSKSNSSFSYTRASSCAFCFHSLCVLFYTTVMKSRRLGHVAFKVWEVKFIVKKFAP